MGQVVNPISMRLNKNRFWLSNWSTNSLILMKEYYTIDLSIQKYLNWLIKKEFFQKFGLILSDFSTSATYSNLNVIINYHFTHELGEEIKRLHFSLFHDLKKYLKKRYQNNTKFKELLKRIQKLNNENINSSYLKTFIFLKYSKKKKKRILFYTTFFKYFFNFILRWVLVTFFQRVNLIIQRLFSQIANIDIRIKFKRITEDTITAKFLITYMIIKLKKKFSLKYVLNSVIKFLKNTKKIEGYKIKCSGRFDKKQRATYLLKQLKKVSSTGIFIPLDYAFSTLTLKYGLCGIKLWVYRDKL